MARGPKVLVIGLDGGTLDLLGPWMREGLLPNLSMFQQEGVVGRLRSTIPPVTAPAWVSFQTGVNPGKHGLFDFTQYQPGSYETRFINSTDINVPTIWQIASQHGKKVAVINVPVTYPPQPLNGVMVAGMLTPDTAKTFTYPPQFQEELLSWVTDYEIFLPVRTIDYLGIAGFVDRLLQITGKRAELALYLLGKERWDLFMVHFQSPDILQHALWPYIDSAHPDYPSKDERDRARVLEYYQRLDSHVGEIERRAEDESTYILMSDHGFGPLSKRLYLNRWLANEGFLALRSGARRRGLLNLAGSLARKVDFLKLRRRFLAPFSERDRLLTRLQRDALIDWPSSLAYALSGSVYAPIYLNCRGREPAGRVEMGTEYEDLRTVIVERLKALRDPATGSPVIDHVYRREEVYQGALLERMPDLIVKPLDGFMVSDLIRGDNLIGPVPEMLSGGHRMDGVLMLRGPGVASGATVSNAEIIDLAPSILYLLGIPLPSHIDGGILQDCFAPDYLERNPPQYAEESRSSALQERADIYSPKEALEIEERLKGMGYLD